MKLERHAYAPELNRLHFPNGKSVPVPNAVTIAQAKEMLSPAKPEKGQLRAHITFIRKNEKGETYFHKVYSGVVSCRLQAIEFAREKQATIHKGGKLLDGSYLPTANYSIRFSY